MRSLERVRRQLCPNLCPSSCFDSPSYRRERALPFPNSMKPQALEAIGKHSTRSNKQEKGYSVGTRELQRWSQNMATPQEWKDVAVKQGARADQAQRKVEALEDALSLLLNGQMVEFHTCVWPKRHPGGNGPGSRIRRQVCDRFSTGKG
jgi:hypothetical protein